MIEYIVNKDKRTIVAMINFGYNQETFKHSGKIYNNIFNTLKSLKKEGTSFFDIRKDANFNKMYFPIRMSAKAKCSLEDEWNEEYGKQLARQRLVEKIHSYRSNSYKIIAEMVQKINDIVM